MLSDEEHTQITKALQQWANRAPKDEPVIGFLSGGRFLTPFQVFMEVMHDTPDGKAVLTILEHGVRREGLQRVVNRLTDEGI